MATIRLNGKYAIGLHRYAIVDDDMVEFLSRWKWKAKPNACGSSVYAVRDQKLEGKMITVRMHRVVLGLERGDQRDVDHINNNGLDNQRANLRVVSRKENSNNIRPEYIEMNQRRRAITEAKSRIKRQVEREVLLQKKCKWCGTGYHAAKTSQSFCTSICRHRYKNELRRQRRRAGNPMD